MSTRWARRPSSAALAAALGLLAAGVVLAGCGGFSSAMQDCLGEKTFSRAKTAADLSFARGDFGSADVHIVGDAGKMADGDGTFLAIATGTNGVARYAILALRDEVAEAPRSRDQNLAAFRDLVLHPDGYDVVLFTRGRKATANYRIAVDCLVDQTIKD